MGKEGEDIVRENFEKFKKELKYRPESNGHAQEMTPLLTHYINGMVAGDSTCQNQQRVVKGTVERTLILFVNNS